MSKPSILSDPPAVFPLSWEKNGKLTYIFSLSNEKVTATLTECMLIIVEKQNDLLRLLPKDLNL